MAIRYVGDFLMESMTQMYDEDADVMYLSFGEPKSCISEEKYPGVLYRYDIETRILNGITILSYSQRSINIFA